LTCIAELDLNDLLCSTGVLFEPRVEPHIFTQPRSLSRGHIFCCCRVPEAAFGGGLRSRGKRSPRIKPLTRKALRIILRGAFDRAYHLLCCLAPVLRSRSEEHTSELQS